MQVDEVKKLLETYPSNYEKRDRLSIKLKELLSYNTSITASYSLNSGGSKGSVESKVERHVIKICETKEQIKELNHKINIIDNATKVLNNKEKQVIELIKIHGYRLTLIARLLKTNKKYIYTTKERAIKKMSLYI